MVAQPLDHLVINTRFETSAAADVFGRLGFTLTPRGRHAMGSVNHLMVFGNDYLELIGLPEEEGAKLREEILNAPAGIDGLVFKTDDANGVHTRLTARGLPLQPLHAFSRPVEIDGQSFEAAFRTVRFAPDTFSAGRLYYCQHLTPELIWRKGWQQHANKTRSLAGLLLVSDDPNTDAQRYAEIARGDVVASADSSLRIKGAQYSIIVRSKQDYADRYGTLGCDALGRSSHFGALGLRISDPVALHDALDALGDEVRYRKSDDRTLVALPRFNSLLEFVHGDAVF